jgi:hypothetical protein
MNLAGGRATAPHDRPDRIHVIGRPGSGKTHFAHQLSIALGIDHHRLDEVAVIGGQHAFVHRPDRLRGRARLRDEDAREPFVRAILEQDCWITEGVDHDWATPVLDRADAIVWLDNVSRVRASGRIIRRYLAGCADQLRSGWSRPDRMDRHDFARVSRDLVFALRETRRYERKIWPPPKPGADLTPHSRSARRSRDYTLAFLDPYRAKLIHCRTDAEVAASFRELTGSALDGATAAPAGDIALSGD